MLTTIDTYHEHYSQIGIQIRIGDWQLVSSHRYFFHPQNYPHLFRHYFDCAEEIETDVINELLEKARPDPYNMTHPQIRESSGQPRVVW